MTSKAMLLLSSALLSTALAATAAAEEPTSSKTAIAAIAESTNGILQGDSARALKALEATPAAEFLGKDADYRACMLERYHAKQPVLTTSAIDDPFVRGVLDDYQAYWWRAMAAPSQRDAQEAALLAKLHKRLGASAAKATDMDTIEPLLQTQLEQHGYHAQLGRTPPLRELMVWRKQDTRMFDVQLPDGPYTVRVELLDDFVSRGWTAYGRCERGSAGGWATDKALYAVVPSYTEGLDSEAFRVVFLGHETQHFADQNAYPGILPWELEYRAKLVELAQGREVSAKRLGWMVTAQSDDMSSPHTYANKRVVADLTKRLGKAPGDVSIDELQAAAREQLLDDTRQRKATAPAGAVAK
jgi:hypothetical protein